MRRSIGGLTIALALLKEGVTGKKHMGRDYARKSHGVEVERKSRSARVFGTTRIEDVASLHHGAVKATGEDIEVVGRSPDGVVEAIESKDRKARGYQFHPEMERAQRRALFRDVVNEAKRSASYRHRARRSESGGAYLLRTRANEPRRSRLRPGRRDAAPSKQKRRRPARQRARARR